MVKVWQQIGFEADIFSWLREEQTARRQKTLTDTVNEVIKNYQIMVHSIDKARLQIEQQEKAKKEAEEMLHNYRGQIVNEK